MLPLTLSQNSPFSNALIFNDSISVANAFLADVNIHHSIDSVD